MASGDKKPGRTGNGRTGAARSAADEALAVNLACGMPIIRAAEAAGVSNRTAHRRLDDPAFQALVRRLRATAFEQAGGQLAFGMSAAAQTLVALLDNESAQVQLGAARAILEMGLKVRDQIELAERLLKVEEALGLALASPVTERALPEPEAVGKPEDEESEP